MGQKRTYKQYSKEYKEEAVALVREQGYSVPEAAKSLGLASNMLYRWKDQIEVQREGKIVTADERTELKQLRKENKHLRMEKEILKKARVNSTGQRNTFVKFICRTAKTQCFSRSLIQS
jgi:transposase